MYLLSDPNQSREKQKKKTKQIKFFKKKKKIQFYWEQETMEKKFKHLNEKTKKIVLWSY